MTGTEHCQNLDSWNDSLSGDYLWSDTNFGEAVTEVMTPLSWTVLKLIYGQWVLYPKHSTVGNIGGRPYLNISLFASVLRALGRSRQDTLDNLEGTLYMNLPEGFEIPAYPIPKRSLPAILFAMTRTNLRERRGTRRLSAYLASNPGRCRQLRQSIRQAKGSTDLLALWQEQVQPHVLASVWQVMGSVSTSTSRTMALRRTLKELVGPDDAQLLISNLSSRTESSGGTGLLASLGPVVGMAQVARGEMEREAYLEQYGHRGPNEFELCHPRPAEDPAWLDRELVRFQQRPVAVEEQLAQHRDDVGAAWTRFERQVPDQADAMRRQINEAAHWARMRESARSEYVRDRWLVRGFALRAGELTGLGDGVFFLAIDGLLALLAGDETAAAAIPEQRDKYERYRALPAYPSIIAGHFDPFQWAAKSGQQTDLYDARAPRSESGSRARDANMIHGSPGSAGQVEGIVRRIDRPEDGEQFQIGEILVTRQTDIAWTLLFPRAAAVITDVGAPLSHAAIVARELGIPAVVGCGDATMELQTGDRVRVDGGRGMVKILHRT